MKKANIVIGTQFGDEGKGKIVDYLTRIHGTDLIVKFIGGSNPGHNIVTPDGIHHCFAQFGSGIFNSNCRTYISKYALVDPIMMLEEDEELRDKGCDSPLGRTYIDKKSLLITPFQVAANRIKEMARGDNLHGSCGKGVGEARHDYLIYKSKVPFIDNINNHKLFRKKLNFIRKLKYDEIKDLIENIEPSENLTRCVELFDEAVIYETMDWCDKLRSEITIVDGLKDVHFNNVIFEGAQGVLLDEWYGFHPHTTWATTTQKYALNLLETINFNYDDITTIGVTRSYITRHGAGPLPTECPEKLYGYSERNCTNDWQKNFRNGYFDYVLFKYAMEVSGIKNIALTHLDEFNGNMCIKYDMCESLPIKDKLEDLKFQQKLTSILYNCKPVIRKYYYEAFESIIKQHCNIIIKSYGPSSKHTTYCN